MVAESSFKGFPGHWGRDSAVQGDSKYNVWPTVASVHLQLPPESLAAGNPLCKRVKGPQKADGTDKGESLVMKEVLVFVEFLVWF